MKQTYSQKCELCKKKFTFSAYPSQAEKRRFCGQSCATKATVHPIPKTKTRNCKLCGLMFLFSHAQSLYCSRKCKVKYPLHFRHNKTAVCLYCKNEFSYHSRVKPAPLYCSRKCSNNPEKMKGNRHRKGKLKVSAKA